MAIDDSRVMFQIVVSLTDNSRDIIYHYNMFIVQATELKSFYWHNQGTLTEEGSIQLSSSLR